MFFKFYRKLSSFFPVARRRVKQLSHDVKILEDIVQIQSKEILELQNLARKQGNIITQNVVPLLPSDINYFVGSFKKSKSITKGNGSGKKYYIQCDRGEEYFIKLIQANDPQTVKAELAKANSERSLMEHIETNLQLPVLVPIDIAETSSGIYIINRWITGKTLRSLLAKTTCPRMQHELGLKAGAIIKRLHDNTIVTDKVEKKKHTKTFKKLINKMFKSYDGLETSNEETKKIAQYVINNLNISNNLPICIVHGDLNMGNMMVDKFTSEYTLIDFWPGIRYADPLFDFRIFIFYSKYPAFLTGFVNGYTLHNPSQAFWEKVRFYSHIQLLFNIGNQGHDPKRIQRNLEHSKELLAAFGSIENPINPPSLYLGRDPSL